ncbi:hypothetical protein [Methylocaldum sp.]|uniref:hypothetical protein n=1 Tax=Methylocaldum sp. TaxID=1969727 RepID=UPI002D440801|nr:hypothetical protein [Methylocaldum sp.]HYE37513.1 hypothetical protein [Methylocaldum sp.]
MNEETLRYRILIPTPEGIYWGWLLAIDKTPVELRPRRVVAPFVILDREVFPTGDGNTDRYVFTTRGREGIVRRHELIGRDFISAARVKRALPLGYWRGDVLCATSLGEFLRCSTFLEAQPLREWVQNPGALAPLLHIPAYREIDGVLVYGV